MLFKGGSGPRDGMSVDLEAQIIEANLDPVAYVSVDPWFGAIVFRVGDLRGAGLMVGFNPIQGNPHHGEVWGNYPKHRDFAALAQWFVELPEVSIAP